MENLTTLRHINLIELSRLEQIEIQGGIVVSYQDSQGYLWMYSYDLHGDLIGITVTKVQCTA